MEENKKLNANALNESELNANALNESELGDVDGGQAIAQNLNYMEGLDKRVNITLYGDDPKAGAMFQKEYKPADTLQPTSEKDGTESILLSGGGGATLC